MNKVFKQGVTQSDLYLIADTVSVTHSLSLVPYTCRADQMYLGIRRAAIG